MSDVTNDAGLAPAIREIERLAKAAHKTTILDAPKSEPPGTYYLVGHDGKAERIMAEPPWDDFKLDTPVELLRFVEKNSPDDDGGAVFYGEDWVVYVFDQDDRRSRATCELTRSAAFNWLTAASSAPSMIRQADFVRLLRITFRGCLPNDNLLVLIRQLKFTAGSLAVGDLQHGRESMGKSITAAITGEAAIPEDVTLIVPVFENHQFTAPVACALEIMPQEGAFRLTPYPMEVRRAMDAALGSIAELFDGDALPPIYRGRPQ